MHAVDRVDNAMNQYSFPHRVPKWTKTAFDGMFKMAISNAWVIYQINNSKKISQRKFIEIILDHLRE